MQYQTIQFSLNFLHVPLVILYLRYRAEKFVASPLTSCGPPLIPPRLLSSTGHEAADGRNQRSQGTETH